MKTLWASRDKVFDKAVTLRPQEPQYDVSGGRYIGVKTPDGWAKHIPIRHWPGPPIAPGECIEIKIVRADDSALLVDREEYVGTLWDVMPSPDKEGVYDSMCLTRHVEAGDKLVELGEAECVGGDGRQKFYRRIEREKPDGE